MTRDNAEQDSLVNQERGAQRNAADSNQPRSEQTSFDKPNPDKTNLDTTNTNKTDATQADVAQTTTQPPRRSNAARELRQGVAGGGRGSSAAVKATTQVQAQTVQFADYRPEQPMLVSISSAKQQLFTSVASAKVERILVNNGQMVAAGEVLMQLSSDDLMLNLAQQQSNVAQLMAQNELANIQFKADDANYQQAKLDVQKEQLLVKQSLSSEAALNSKTQLLQAAELKVQKFSQEQAMRNAQLSQASLQLQQIEALVAELTVTAQFAAQVVDIAVTQGQSVAANQSLIDIVDASAYVAQGQIPLSMALALQGRKDIVAYPSQPRGNTSTQLQWPLSSLGQKSLAGVVDIEFSLNSTASQSWLLGENIQVLLQMPEVNAVLLPADAVYFNQQVYVIENNKLAARDVLVVGHRFVDGVAMALVQSSALNEGDQLLITRLSSPTSGMAVSILER